MIDETITALPSCAASGCTARGGIPVDVSGYTAVSYDHEPGDGAYRFELTADRQAELIKLLRADRWEQPGDLLARGYTVVMTAEGENGDRLTIGIWDDVHALMVLYNDSDPANVVFYYAPIAVIDDAKTFKDGLAA